MEIGAALSGISSAIGTVKGFVDAKKEFDIAEFRLKMATVMSELANAKLALIDSDQEIRKLREKLEKRESTKRIDGYLYILNEHGEQTGEYYCPKCVHDEKYVPMIPNDEFDRYARCPVCEHSREVEGFTGSVRTMYTDYDPNK